MNLIATPKKRIDSIDILRGIIMVIMALDHVRDFFHIQAMTGDPTDMSTTTPVLFFTRWITHYCAPLFVFLSGTSAFLTGQRRSKKELSLFLLKRGLVLVLFELTLFNFFFSFNPFFSVTGLQVIWVIGLSMIILSALIYLPLKTLFIIGIIMVAGHNLLDRFNADGIMAGNLFWGFLHQSHITPYAPNRMIFVLYPLIPWPGVMLLGYCMGSWYVQGVSAEFRKKKLLLAGTIVTLAFFVIRFINIYGDNIPWSTQREPVITMLSFFNVTKYPPSLLYLCMTIGPALLLLPWLEQTKASFTKYVVIFGRVPMFYYLLHFFLIHFACMIIFFLNGHTISEAPTGMIWFRPVEFGYPLWVVYLIWITLVVLLYPLCKWYSKYKATHTDWWLSYL